MTPISMMAARSHAISNPRDEPFSGAVWFGSFFSAASVSVVDADVAVPLGDVVSSDVPLIVMEVEESIVG